MPKSEYYITNGEKFVKQQPNNQYKTVSNFAIADSWDSCRVAKSILDNSIPRVWRNTFYVAKYDEGSFIKCSLSQDEKSDYRNEVLKQETERYDYKLDLYSFDNDTDVQHIIDGFESVCTCLKKAETMSFKLQKQASTLDYILEDLKHYRLKKKLGTVDSYKFKKIVDAVVKKRMSVKNQIEILNKINQHKKSIGDQLMEICGVISSVKDRTYKPRVLTDLFEKGIDYIKLEELI